MKEIIFATGNAHKVKEIKAMLPDDFSIKSLKDIHFEEELPETQATIEGNSLQKAKMLSELIGVDCFAEDTGLEVEVLNGEPGIRSARYAGENKDANDNMDLLLLKLNGVKNRSAQFKTVITFIKGNQSHQFEGILKGQIGYTKIGNNGFGYDPIFVIENGKTLAELSLEEKALISHRGKAVQSFVEFLKKEYL
jgi:XTP/dITP diphosphohydrolase